MGIFLSPETGSNIIHTGKSIDEKILGLKEKLPVGIAIEKVYYQPDLVTSAINNFVWNLILSVITVVGVLLFAMGIRSGLIIGSGLVFSILGTLICMLLLHIDLQRVSLSAFIIAMGMLVDNSIVVVDRVLVLRQQGLAMRDTLLEATKKDGDSAARGDGYRKSGFFAGLFDAHVFGGICRFCFCGCRHFPYAQLGALFDADPGLLRYLFIRCANSASF